MDIFLLCAKLNKARGSPLSFFSDCLLKLFEKFLQTFVFADVSSCEKSSFRVSRVPVMEFSALFDIRKVSQELSLEYLWHFRLSEPWARAPTWAAPGLCFTGNVKKKTKENPSKLENKARTSQVGNPLRAQNAHVSLKLLTIASMKLSQISKCQKIGKTPKRARKTLFFNWKPQKTQNGGKNPNVKFNEIYNTLR